jgi:DNA-binding NarL/FixJ family response regulator
VFVGRGAELLSRNTVQVHMSKVLAKLQARSRVEVAMTILTRAG